MTFKELAVWNLQATQVLRRLKYATLNGQDHFNTGSATRVPSRPLYSTAVARFRHNTPVEAHSVATPGDAVTVEFFPLLSVHIGKKKTEREQYHSTS